MVAPKPILLYNVSMNADFIKAQQLAEATLIKHGVSSPIVNVFNIAQSEGLTLKEFSPEDGELANVAGFFDPASKTIFINKDDATNRQTFTVAHELGHYLLGHDATTYGVLPRWQNPGIEKKPEEKEADCFAANLLVPEDMIKKTMREYGLTDSDEEILAKIFGVSKEVIHYRLLRVRS